MGLVVGRERVGWRNAGGSKNGTPLIVVRYTMRRMPFAIRERERGSNFVDKAAELAAVAAELLAAQDAPLRTYREGQKSQLVPGEGSGDARIMFIGEAPGFHEARQGRPFVGASGKFLDTLLNGVGLRRGDIFITNIVKDRPPDNRAPQKGEIAFYAPFLDRQIAIIQPSVLVTLGRFAMEYIVQQYAPAHKDAKISLVHGQVIDGQTVYGAVKIVPLFHPAVALYDETKREVLIEDFKVLQTV